MDVGRDDTDDRVLRRADVVKVDNVDVQRLSDQVRIGSKPAPPETASENHHA